MREPSSLPQQAVDQFHSMVNRTLSHRERYDIHPSEIESITIRLEQLALSNECAQWFLAAKANGHTLEHLCNVLGIAPNDKALGFTLCMAFLDEHLREPMISAFAAEGEFLHKHDVLGQFESEHRKVAWQLNQGNLETDLHYWRIRESKTKPRAAMPCKAYIPMAFTCEGDHAETALRGLLLPQEILLSVNALFSQLEKEKIDSQQCVAQLRYFVQAFPFQAHITHWIAKEQLPKYPLADNDPLRIMVMGKEKPGLTELSNRVEAQLRKAGEATRPGAAFDAIKHVLHVSASNDFYLNNCLAADLIEIIRRHLGEDEVDPNPAVVGGQSKVLEFAQGYKLLRNFGVGLDLVLLRGVCGLMPGHAYDLLRKGPQAVIKRLLHHYTELDDTITKNFATLTAMHLLGGVLSHDRGTLIQALDKDEKLARLLYEASGETRFLDIIENEEMRQDILAQDLGL
ncbi:hypothetical protein [Pseudomonas sp. S1(2024)]|uniref:hypothetical protein n=1 Tax=Pseudomonas sp. S1(2024) TaxID=3390191 RepID=UPI0039783A08